MNMYNNCGGSREFRSCRADASYSRPLAPYSGSVAPVVQQPMGTGTVVGRYVSMRAVPVSGAPNKWMPMPTASGNSLQRDIPSHVEPTYSGIYHRETEAGIQQITDSGKEKQLATVKLRVAKRILSHRRDGSYITSFVVLVYHEKWDTPREITVLESEYKDLFNIIKKRFPEIAVYRGDSDAAEEYLTAIFEDGSWETVEESEYRGWIELNESTVYAHGTDARYDKAPIPDISKLSNAERLQIFREGLGFLKVGKHSSKIAVIFLFSHLGFSHFWFMKAGIPPHFCCMISGATGILKTAVAKELTNPFETLPERKCLRFSASCASTRDYIYWMQDTTLLIDDFSNTELRSRKDAKALMEDIIRIVGDGVIPSKMEGGKTLLRGARNAVVMTGETDGDLSQSSALRYINVHVLEGDFDGDKLAEYQGTDRMPRYYALLIHALEQNGSKLVEYIRRYLQNARKCFENFGLRRMTDAAVILLMQAAFLCLMGRSLGMSHEDLDWLYHYFENSIVEVLMEHSRENRKLSPAMNFVYCLSHVLDTGEGTWIAASEEVYAKDEAAYLGFRDGTCLWVKFDQSHSLAARYATQQGRDFIATGKQIKEDLKQLHLIQTVETSKGGTEFLVKAKKGSRKRLLVLFEDKFWQAADDCSC